MNNFYDSFDCDRQIEELYYGNAFMTQEDYDELWREFYCCTDDDYSREYDDDYGM